MAVAVEYIHSLNLKYIQILSKVHALNVFRALEDNWRKFNEMHLQSI
jgi:glutaredoxin-related protein